MAQNLEISAPVQRWTRADFTALRAHLNRLPIERIRDLYYTEDDLYDLGIQSVGDLRRRIEDLRDTLIQRASVSNPHMAELLRNARKTSMWSNKLVDHLVRAAETDTSRPKKSDSISIWLKPRVSAVLKNEGMATLGQLIDYIEIRGAGWWKPIPRIGAGKAAAIVNWLQRHPESLGTVDLAPDLPVLAGELIELKPEVRMLVPLERVALPSSLSGADGVNRNVTFPLISARNDLEAIDAYLYKFRAQEKTRRAYQKELERFLLWCVYERRKPMSSVLMGDCEAYKDFLAAIPGEWSGRKVQRHSTGWRPFVGQIAPSSQKYAVQAVRTFFDWLIDVRYLSGNPWKTVADPAVAQAISPLKIEKALPPELWEKLVAVLDELCAESDEILRQRFRLRGGSAKISIGGQFRLARAALLLMGDAGLRREEVAGALRCNLRPSPDDQNLWELDVLGKRNKWRTTFPSLRAVEAVKVHWRDRGDEFDFGMSSTPLLSPLVLPGTAASASKHGSESAGFSADGVYQLVKATLLRVVSDPFVELESHERDRIREAGCHAFRHTFGVAAVEKDVPLDVLQGAFGHASVQTTTIYVQAPKKRAARELGKFFAGR